MAQWRISDRHLSELQYNIIRSHATGAGRPAVRHRRAGRDRGPSGYARAGLFGHPCLGRRPARRVPQPGNLSDDPASRLRRGQRRSGAVGPFGPCAHRRRRGPLPRRMAVGRRGAARGEPAPHVDPHPRRAVHHQRHLRDDGHRAQQHHLGQAAAGLGVRRLGPRQRDRRIVRRLPLRRDQRRQTPRRAAGRGGLHAQMARGKPQHARPGRPNSTTGPTTAKPFSNTRSSPTTRCAAFRRCSARSATRSNRRKASSSGN